MGKQIVEEQKQLDDPDKEDMEFAD